MITTEKQFEKSKTKLQNFKKELKELTDKNQVVAVSKKIGELEKELKDFEQHQKGAIPQDYYRLENLGKLLVALRIKNGLTQQNLASLLGTHQSQVARDEKNEYQGAALKRIQLILKTLNEEFVLK